MEMPIGQRIRTWRKHFSRSQADCAEAMGIRDSGLSRIENGWRDNGVLRFQQVTAEQLEKLAAFLGLTMAEFYGDIPDTPSPATGNDPVDKIAAAQG
jgi:transcriptional regulator with XRE-family HTH domain